MTEKKMEEITDFRLPKTFIPENYQLVLTPDLEEFTFDGFVKIYGRVEERSSDIVLHSVDLTFGKEDVMAISKKCGIFRPIMSNSVEFDTERNFAILKFAESLPLGEIELIIVFKGVLNDLLKGFYRSKYFVDGEERYMATTQLEETEARRVFPCFDEPNLKATFDITLKIPKNLDAVSNMPVKAAIEDDDVNTLRFERTPKMSTYLPAFVVGELESIEKYTKNGTLMRAFATPGKVEQCEFALDVAVHTLEYLEDYFEIPYPLPKLDMLAIPDFAFGAMENWGLVVFREVLLFKDDRTSKFIIQRIVEIIVHEFVHMWIGNLASTDFWDHLWLNEGLTCYVTPKGIKYVSDKMDLGFNLETKFFKDEMASTLGADSLRSTHPVMMPVGAMNDVGQTFDMISYQKGACVTEIMAEYLSPEVFRKCIQYYLEKHAYGSVTTDMLFEDFEEVSKKAVAEFMHAWILEPGYPVVTVEKIEGREITLSQSRFLSNGAELTEEEKAQVWHIPLGILKTDGTIAGSILLTEPVQTLELPCDAEEFLKLNAGYKTLARVNYPDEIFAKIKDSLSGGILSKEDFVVDRAGLINDAYAFAKAGKLDTTVFLSLLESYDKEKEYLVWTQIIAALGGVSSILSTEGENNLNLFSRHILAQIASDVGWQSQPDESFEDALKRPLVIAAYGQAGDPGTIKEAGERFEGYLKDPKSLSPDLFEPVVNLIARNGDTQMFADLSNYYRVSRDRGSIEEIVRLLKALALFNQEELVQKGLEFLLSDEVRGQDVIHYMRGIPENRAAVRVAWEFFKDNVEEIVTKIGQEMYVGNSVKLICSGFSTERDALETEEYFEQNPIKKTSLRIAEAVEIIRTKAVWIERDGAAIEKWLAEWVNKH